MSSLLNIGTAATRTFQTALAVTSHNIANIGTEGYNRQRADIVSNTSQFAGAGFVGSGSRVDIVNRIHANYIQDQLSSTNSLKVRYEEQLSLAKNVEGIVASNDEGVQEFMQRLFDSFHNLAENPVSTTNRQLVLDESRNMESLIGNMSAVLQDSQQQANTQIRDLTGEINNRLDLIKAVNTEVQTAFSSGTQPPNDLLDQRDQAIFELNGYMDIKTFPGDKGIINVYTGDGRLPLVGDNTITYLQAQRSEFTNENRTEIFMNVGGEMREVSSHIKQGQLGAVLDYRNNMLDKSMNDLGLMLNGVVAATNWQHYQGYDINGDAGGNFYEPLNINALKSNKNAGAEDGTGISVNFLPKIDTLAGFNGQPPYSPGTQPDTFGDKETFLATANTAIGDFKAREYEIRVNGAGDFEIFDHKANNNTPLATVPFNTNAEIDGLNFDFTGVAAGSVSTGDKFLVKPHQEMMGTYKSVLSHPDLIAARGQSPVDTNADGSLLDEVPATASDGDNVNMANMASLQSLKILYSDISGSASETLLGGYSRMATNVGMYVRGTDIQLTAQTSVFEQIQQRRESMSGVSLDEEAANLMRFQKSYQASAQILQTSQTLFQTILGAIN